MSFTSQAAARPTTASEEEAAALLLGILIDLCENARRRRAVFRQIETDLALGLIALRPSPVRTVALGGNVRIFELSLTRQHALTAVLPIYLYYLSIAKCSTRLGASL